MSELTTFQRRLLEQQARIICRTLADEEFISTANLNDVAGRLTEIALTFMDGLEGQIYEAYGKAPNTNKVGAIKLHRSLTGSGLKEAKEAVEDMASRLRWNEPA